MAGGKWLDKLKRKVPGLGGSPDPDWPDWYLTYHQAYHDLARPQVQGEDEMSLVVVDAETTGTDVKKDYLISLGAIRVKGNSILIHDHFEAYLPTPSHLMADSPVNIHGIIPNSLRYKYDTEAGLLSRFLEFLGPEGIIVGHHIGFDVKMINLAMARHGAGRLLNRVIDTGLLAQRIQPVGYWTPPEKHSLDNLARRYRIPLSDRHTALGDAYITAVLWLKLVERLRIRVGRPLTVDDF